MKITVQKVKHPFIPDRVPAGAWHGLTKEPARINTARLAARTHIPVVGLLQQPAVGPSQCWLSPCQSTLIYRTKLSPGSSGCFPTQSPSVLPAAQNIPKSPHFKQRLGCNSFLTMAHSVYKKSVLISAPCPFTLPGHCLHSTASHTNIHCIHTQRAH